MTRDLSRRRVFAIVGAVVIDRQIRRSGLANFGAAGLLGRPSEAGGQADWLSATLTWQDPSTRAGHAGAPVRVQVSRRSNGAHPLVDVLLPEGVTTYRLAVAPMTTYHWRIVPLTARGRELPARAAQGVFTTGAPRRDPQAEVNAVRYAGIRAGTDWEPGTTPMPADVPSPPLSPWFAHKRYDGTAPPTFEAVQGALPIPILDAEPHLLAPYWYSWRILINQWLFPPTSPDHQAVANQLGIPDWGPFGSTMVWDTSFMLQFARYGHAAYPFVTALDNCYARQHDNGFICREADKNNHDVFGGDPLNDPLFAWAEWQYYQLTGDQARLAQVLTPIVKQYEWWQRFQRRETGLYWLWGSGEGMDDSPRNTLMYAAMSATAAQALAALSLARIAKVVGRPDLVDYFTSEHAALGALVNARCWDETHQLYNDLAKDGRLITELTPGSLCKHGFIFWPMLAEIAPPDRVQGLVRELRNPQSFCRSSGVPSLSADSAGYNPPSGGYWKGAVWPPIQGIVQRGLTVCGQWDLAQQLARKYLDAVTTAYQRQHTITEFLHPDEPVADGNPEFVGWGGIGPIQDLIEYILGFEVCAPTQTVTWRITRTDRHGITNLRLGSTTVDLLCASRPALTAPCALTATSTAPFTLVVHRQDTVTTHHLRPGVTQLIIG